MDLPMDIEDDESTALITLDSIGRLAHREPKDRHLLVRVRGSGLGQVTRLGTERAVVGRNPDAGLFVPDEGVSRRHAVLLPEDETFVVVDTDSANGTFIGGQRITRQALRDGDLVQFGPSAAFRYTLTDQNQETLLRQLFEASVTDALTGAYNREHLDAHLRSELSFARRHKTDVSLVLFDVDHFKRVNDTFGHQAGDQVLMEISRTVEKMVRGEDLFARYGGEEFAVVLRGVGPMGGMSLGERLRLGVQALSIPAEKGPIAVTVSLGCASVSELTDATPEALIGMADKRLYAAKRSGRNRVVASD
jgi:two-component system cell cycle response regulator